MRCKSDLTYSSQLPVTRFVALRFYAARHLQVSGCGQTFVHSLPAGHAARSVLKQFYPETSVAPTNNTSPVATTGATAYHLLARAYRAFGEGN
jgi:hypothetical protein